MVETALDAHQLVGRGASPVTPRNLNFGQMFDDVKRVILKHNLPLPAKPKGEDPEFLFPTDPSGLNTTQLGQMMLRFTAFFGYCQRLLSLLESELVMLDAEYKLKVNANSLAVREKLGRLNADVIEAAVVADNADLTPMYKRRLELAAIRKQLEGRLTIYEKCGQTLSRELSRREMEARMTQ